MLCFRGGGHNNFKHIFQRYTLCNILQYIRVSRRNIIILCKEKMYIYKINRLEKRDKKDV